MLRQQQAANLAELRRLRLDWLALGTGEGLDPVLAMELEAAGAAAERAILADVLKLVTDGQLADAEAKLGSLDDPRHLPAAVADALPELRTELARVVPFARARTELQKPNPSVRATWEPLANVPPKQLPPALTRAVAQWRALANAHALLLYDLAGIGTDPYTVADYERQLKAVADTAGSDLAKRLRCEFAARLFLINRASDATQLLDGEVDPVYAAAVLADLRAIVLGRGEITTPQLAAFVRIDGTPPAQVAAILPPDQLTKWKPPARKPGEPLVDVAIAGARTKLKAEVEVEVHAGTARVNAIAARAWVALTAEAAVLKPFLEKVEAMRGKPFTSAVQRQLAAVAGSHGLTVAETIGVLATEANRPVAEARLVATVPVFGEPGAT
jgi:hypothetical protein